jgi:hypothetical protein
MRSLKFALALVVVWLVTSGTAFAQQPSVTYMPLVSSTQFLNRVTFNIAQTVAGVETEAANAAGANAACHTLRVQLAVRVASNPAGFAPTFAIQLVTTGAITTAGALTGAYPLTLDSPATDGAIFSAIGAMWSTIAGCVTNP